VARGLIIDKSGTLSFQNRPQSNSRTRREFSSGVSRRLGASAVISDGRITAGRVRIPCIPNGIRPVASRHEGCYIDFAGNFPRVVARLNARDADFLQKGSRCTEDPLRGLWRLRFGLPTRLPWRAWRKRRAGSAGRMYQRGTLRLCLPGSRHPDEVGTPGGQPLHRTMATAPSKTPLRRSATECRLNFRPLKWNRGRRSGQGRSSHPATDTMSPPPSRHSGRGYGHDHWATARC